MACGQEAAEGAQAWIWVGAAPRLAPSSVEPFFLSVSRGGSGGGSCRASPEVADADQLRAPRRSPSICGSITSLPGLPHADPDPRGHSGLDLRHSGQIKPTVLLGLVT